MINYEQIKAAWDKVKQTRGSQFSARVPTLSGLEAVTVSMVTRDATSVTIQFDNLDEATDSVSDVARLKATILDWLREFAQVRLSRGTQGSLVVAVELKPEFERKIQASAPQQKRGAKPRPGGPQTAVVGRTPVRGDNNA